MVRHAWTATAIAAAAQECIGVSLVNCVQESVSLYIADVA